MAMFPKPCHLKAITSKVMLDGEPCIKSTLGRDMFGLVGIKWGVGITLARAAKLYLEVILATKGLVPDYFFFSKWIGDAAVLIPADIGLHGLNKG
jgi:hypothetical protein